MRPIYFYLLALIILSSSVSFGQKIDLCNQEKEVVKTLEQWHYSPRNLDSSFYSGVFNDCVELLDPSAYVFSKEDIDNFIASSSVLGCEGVVTLSKLYERRVSSLDSVTRLWLETPFDYSSGTLILPSTDLRSKTSDLEKVWAKKLKLKVLYAYFASDSSAVDKALDKEKIAAIQREVLTRKSCEFQEILHYKKGLEAYVGERYLKALALQYDPHTQFFTKEDVEGFNSGLSKQTASFGLAIKKNKVGEIEIDHLIPGGPAWNSNLINEEDVILEVEDKGQLISFSCLHFSEINKILFTGESDSLKFHLRKRSGKDFWVKLGKAVIDVESNNIKSFLLEGDTKIGYIYLPSFYADFESNYPPKGCSNDFATELIRLKREGIKGLVLDLRDNGGGSMEEAVKMVGIFINYGAVCLEDDQNGDILTLKDMNRGRVYSDPLVVITNQFSASASELFAASIQDQNRGVIVGARTYGKATVQTILPSNAYDLTTAVEPEAYVKVTLGKFYRVTGNSHQKEGVIPDIEIPNFYSSFEIGERYEKHCLPATTIEKKVYYYPADSLPIADLKQKSQVRLDSNLRFTELLERGTYYYSILNKQEFDLSFLSFKSYYKSILESFSQDDVSFNSVFTVHNPSYIQGVSSVYEDQEEVNQTSMDDIKSDALINESFLILNDLIENLKQE